MSLAFTFPGQGSQSIGMGKALAEAFPVAREVFEEVDEALSQSLSRLMWEGSNEDLTLTENTQPALMAVSVAAMRALEKEVGADVGAALYVAGHSLGEYSALCAAGALSVADTARLLRIRGQAMQKAVPVGDGAMAAVLGLDLDAVQKAIDETAGDGVCQIANDNAPGQVVISGAAAKVEAVIEAAKTAGAKRALPLPVSAPFHCTLMAPAAEAMQEALAAVDMKPPRTPVVANVVANAVSEPSEIKRLLVEQVTGRVRWTESVAYMADKGVATLVEVGAGKVLSGLARRINKDLKAVNVGAPDDFEAYAAL
ncbi:MAG: ACP S-malonyltransferase [Pseudomonadota bacterium]